MFSTDRYADLAINRRICGYRAEEIEDKLMQQFRYLDKLLDELGRPKAIDKILRK